MKTREQLIEYYEKEHRKVEKQIMAILEVDKNPRAREKRLEEIDMILGYLDHEHEKELKRLKEENSRLRRRLEDEGININELYL